MPTNLIEKAERGAYAWHKGQARKYTNEPYFVHPKAVVAIVKTVPHTEAMLWPHGCMTR